MKQSVRLGRVAGIPVGAHWSVAVILVIIAELLAVTVLPGAFPHQSAGLYWVVAGAAAVVFLASLLAHELAHALVARRNGVGVRSITLWMLGGMAELDGDPPSAGADLRIALAGPAASLAAGVVLFGAGVAIGAAGGPGVAVAAATWLAVMNGILAVFNLLPGAPLDGGRVLRAVLWRHYGDRGRAERGAARAGRVLGAVMIGLGIGELLALRSLGGLWLMLIGWFLITAAAAEEKAAAAKTALAGRAGRRCHDSGPGTRGRLGERVGVRSAGPRRGPGRTRSRWSAPAGTWPGWCWPASLPASPRATGTGCGWTRWPWLFRPATAPRPMTRPARCSPAARSAARWPRLSLTAAG